MVNRTESANHPFQNDPPEYRPGNSRIGRGCLASDVEDESLEWFFDPLFPYKILSMVVGDKNTGKSTFGAWLCANAKRPAVLPGFEESISLGLNPRLRANDAVLESTLVLRDRRFVLPGDRGFLTTILQDFGCDLLWVDPVSSYIGEVSENDGPGVRVALEALAQVAVDVGCAVVCARHPGKAPGNVMPGSREWANVPRVIVQLHYYEGPPVSRLITPWKDGFGVGWKARAFELVGPPRTPKRFVLGEVADSRAAELVAVSDKVERWKIDQAAEFLIGYLAGQQIDSREVYLAAEKERFSDRTLLRAMREVGGVIVREGSGKEHRAMWSLPPHLGGPDLEPPAPPPTPPPPLPPSDRETPPGGEGGVSVSDGGSGGGSPKPEKTAPAKKRHSRRKKGQGGPPADKP